MISLKKRIIPRKISGKSNFRMKRLSKPILRELCRRSNHYRRLRNRKKSIGNLEMKLNPKNLSSNPTMNRKTVLSRYQSRNYLSKKLSPKKRKSKMKHWRSWKAPKKLSSLKRRPRIWKSSGKRRSSSSKSNNRDRCLSRVIPNSSRITLKFKSTT